MDHALSGDSSKRPGEKHHVEGFIRVWQSLRGTDGKPHVADALLARCLSCGGYRVGVWIETLHSGRQRRDTQRESSVAAPQIEDAFTPNQARPAPLAQLMNRIGSERGRERWKVSSDVTYPARHTALHDVGAA